MFVLCAVLCVVQSSSVRTGLPFHVDGPFFVSRTGGKASLVMDSLDNSSRGKGASKLHFKTVPQPYRNRTATVPWSSLNERQT